MFWAVPTPLGCGIVECLEKQMHPGRGRLVSTFLLLLCSLCADGTARAQNLMVADFEDGKVESVHGLALIPLTDEQFGGTSEARLALSHPGADGSRGAVRISLRITNDFASPFAGAMALLGAEGLATDLSAYKGLRFYARSKEGAFIALIGQFSGQATRYMAPFEARSEWTLVELPFDKFQRAPPAGNASLVPEAVVTIGFTAAPQLRGEVDLAVDRWAVSRWGSADAAHDRQAPRRGPRGAGLGVGRGTVSCAEGPAFTHRHARVPLLARARIRSERDASVSVGESWPFCTGD